MRVFRKAFLVLFILLLFLVVGGIVFLRSQKPQYNGTVQVPGLSERVEVIYDFYGIPHIYAENAADAYFALGYAHAQDRLFQMELVRRLSSGRLAEILGSSLVETDVFFRTLSLDEHAKESARQFLDHGDPQARLAMRAYLKGINRYIERGRLPVEFYLIGFRPEPFTEVDCFLSGSYMAFNFAMAFRTDPVLSFISRKLGPDYLQSLSLEPDSGSWINRDYRIRQKDSLDLKSTTQNLMTVLERIPLPLWQGSNAWVLSPAKSRSGKVLFENDTHIAYGQPAVWYEAHLEYPGFSLYGNHLALMPFAAIGHTPHHAWGLTMLENDDLDFFEIRQKPGDTNKYWYNGKWADYRQRTSVIHVKGEEDTSIVIRSTHTGPLIHEAMTEWKKITPQPVALSWTHTRFMSNLPEVAWKLNQAKNMEEARYAASLLISPGLNILYGDSAGDIAWWCAGRLIKRGGELSPYLLNDGTVSLTEPEGYLDFNANPRSENPPEGFVLSANNQPDSIDGKLYPGYYVPDDRARRIESLLTNKSTLAVEDLQKMALDDISPRASALSLRILSLVSPETLNSSELAKSASTILSSWNGQHSREDIGPTIYYKLLYCIFELSMLDELGDDWFKAYMNTHVVKTSLLHFLESEDSPWWDNIDTKDVRETRSMILDQAFQKTLNDLQRQLGNSTDEWEWGKVHFIELAHPLGAQKPLNLFFNLGPYAIAGGNEVINNIGFSLDKTGVYRAKFGPAMRIVLDFADPENSKSVLTSGQSGNLISSYYGDQARMYVQGQYRKQKMNRKEIEENSAGRLMLVPATLRR